jgi:1-acyl-sn-glycerol-3-phosphate acyltransferase
MPIPRGGRGDQEFERLCRGCEEALRRWPFVHFYPEGECYLYNNTVRRFRLGAFWAAAKIDVPVVPMATVFHPGHPGTSRPRVELVVLEPLYPKDFIQYDEAGIVNPESVTAFANAARTRIQAEIDKRRGTGAYYKGAMPRLESINAE